MSARDDFPKFARQALGLMAETGCDAFQAVYGLRPVA